MDPLTRIDQLRTDPPSRRALLRPQRSRDLRRRVRSRCCTSSSGSRRSTRIWSRPIRRRSASAGAPTEGFATVEQLAPMLSLDNAYTEEELRAFDERVRRGAGDSATRRSPTSPS